jgi:threonine dehydrogenase-like Zn-dependent dehydrogenase
VETRRALAARCGIPHTVGGAPDEAHRAIADLTGGRMCDIAVDAVGHSAVVRQALGAAATFGQVILLGSPRVPVEGDLTRFLSDVHVRFITVRGALEWCLPIYPQTGAPWSQAAKQEMIFDWLARGVIAVAPLVSHRLPPEKIRDAYEGLEREPGTYTGVVLDWTRAA